MNRSLLAAVALVLFGVLAVEGKLGALWTAITTMGSSSGSAMQNVGSATVNTSTLVSSQNASSGGNPTTGVPGLPTSTSGTNPVSGALSAGSAVAALLAARKYAVDHGTDPALNDYYYHKIITNDPTYNAGWQSFINCYLQGGNITDCASRYLPKG